VSDNPLVDFAREAEPSPALRRRLERSLAARGVITPTSAWRRVGLAAAILVAAGLGFVAGRLEPASLAHGGSQFLLLLREDSSYRDDRPVADIVREYGRWADSLRRNNQLVLAEKLGDERADVVGSQTLVQPGDESPTTGFFLVRAPDLTTARAIAATSPHVKYGGRVVVRPIQRTR
jgi:hypothetical protein